MAATHPPELDWHFLEGLRLFDEGQYHEAHDSLEEVWFDQVGAVKLAAQALIQIAVGLYHREHGNLRGAFKLFRRAAEILEPVAPGVLGLDVADLRRRSTLLAREAEEQARASEPAFDAALIPRFGELRDRCQRRRGELGLPERPPDRDPGG